MKCDACGMQTNDKVTVEVFEEPGSTPQKKDQELIKAVISQFIAPGYRQQDDRLELPSPKSIQSETQTIDGQVSGSLSTTSVFCQVLQH